MSIQQKIPKLRFSGFMGEWEEKQLSTFLIPTLRGIEKPRGSYLAIGVKSHCKGTFHKPDSDPEKIAMETLFVVRENDLIVNITFAWEGAIAIVKKSDDGGLVSHRFPTYIFDRKRAIHEFFQYVFIQKKFRATLELISPGGAGRNRVLSQKEFVKMKCFLPALPEQQKIAHFLTAIDEKINQLTCQKALLEQYKKGVMQQIFSRELRFRDWEGRAFVEWEVKPLGDLCQSIKSGKTTPENEGLFLVYGSTGVFGFCNAVSHTGTYILIARVGANAGALNLVSGQFGVTDNTLVLDVNEKALIEFIYHFLSHFNLNQLVFGSGQPLITGGHLKALKIPLPTLPEQQKIADFLTALDEKISRVSGQVEAVKGYKKGLLQGMFV